MASVEKQIRANVYLLGPMYCGRTALLEVFCSRNFPTSTRTTIGIDFCNLTIKLNNMTLDLRIWDTSGWESPIPNVRTYVSHEDCCVLVFAITSSDSFRKIDKWMNICLEEQRKRKEDCPFVLVGNQADRERDREVSWSQAQTWARSHNMPYFEVSARDGTNVQTLLGEIALLAHEKAKRFK